MMKSKTRFFPILFAAALAAVSIGTAGSVIFAAPPEGKGGGKGGGGDDGGSETTLPPIRYRIAITDLPIPTSFKSYSGLNEIGELVGYFSMDDGQRGVFVFNTASGQFTLVEQLVDLEQLPDGYTLGGALDINDHGVIVGYLIDSEGSYHPCAIDLLSTAPVVDLLPSQLGINSVAFKINNAGDILGLDMSSSGGAYDIAWTINPGLYGEPDGRAPRTDGVALDLRGEALDVVPTIVGYGPDACDLSEPLAGHPAQVAGLDLDRVPFRYTIGTSAVDLYPELTQEKRAYFAGISTSGTFAGQATVVIGKKGNKVETQQVNYRFNPDFDAAYQDLQTPGIPEDINNFDELLFRSVTDPSVFRDWGDGLGERSVNLYDIIVGDSDDVAQFDESVELFHMNDQGIIVGFIYGNATETVVVLTPESVDP